MPRVSSGLKLRSRSMPGIRFSVKGMSMGYICYYCIETEIVQNLRSALF